MDLSEGQSMKQKAETLWGYSTAPLPSSLAKVLGSSKGIPSEKDFHFYHNFDEFKVPIKEIANKSQSILDTIGTSAEHLWAKVMAFPEDYDDAYDWVVNVNDEIFERFDVSVDEFKKLRKKEEETGVRLMGLVDNYENGFQLVYGKKKKLLGKDAAHNSTPSAVKVASRDNKTMGTKQKIPFHIPTIPRPQDEYKILVNNANQPFEHVWLQRSEDGSRFIHPLEKFSVLDFVDKDVSDVEPVKPPPVECSPFKHVEEVKDLKDLAARLQSVDEFAVDLEHNYYRSFQGLTCLMQISTRAEDFVVDTLKLRIHIGPYLREVFKDPTKKKVMHGATMDIIWLQRDFGIYVCNLFDTGQASRVLKMERYSLEHLLQHFCGVTANKEYQNADWRLRPLPDVMMRYAREDTHYLLHIYDLMRRRLASSSSESESSETPIVEVYKRSNDICMQLYEKEVLTESSYLHIYGLQGADLNAQQLSIVAALCEWRDTVARAEDESTGYILPNRSLLEIAKQMPVTANNLRHVLKSKHPFVERNLGSVVGIIRHSIQNAAAFEDAAKHLKEARMEMESARSTKNTNGYESLHPQEAPSRLTATAVAESVSCISEHFGNDGNVKNEKDGYAAGVSRESCTKSGQIRETNTSMNLLHTVSGAAVQVQKKPSHAFGALLGNSASKRKFDPDKKAKEEMKVEQIKSSVNFPLHSFMGRTEHSQPLVKEPAKPLETLKSHGEPVSVPATGSNSKDIISLESDSDSDVEKAVDADLISADDRLKHGEDTISGSVIGNDERKPISVPATTSSNSKDIILLLSDSDSDSDVEKAANAVDDIPGSVVENDEGDDQPMSLSDLSSSFQKCFPSTNQTRKTMQIQNAHECRGLSQLKPFDYEAALKGVSFGEGSRKRAEGDEGRRKKKLVVGQSREDGRSGDFQQGRRRQAFPATGNRSATFR